MANHSKMILEQNNSKHTSRLIKSIESLTKDPQFFTEKPSGVWGSTAVIKLGGVTIKSADLDFEFNVPFDDDLEANEGEITVYNLADNTIKRIKVDETVTIDAGYADDTGNIFNGVIAKVTTTREGADRVTTIKVVDKLREDPTVTNSFSAGEPKTAVLDWLLEQAKAITKMPVVKQYDTESGGTLENDEAIEEPLSQALRTYSEACGVSTFINKGSIYCGTLDKLSVKDEFKVSTDTGMIGSPNEFEEKAEDTERTIEGYKVDMLLQYRITAGSKIDLYSDNLISNADENGTGNKRSNLYVRRGTHSFSPTESVTNFEAIYVK